MAGKRWLRPIVDDVEREDKKRETGPYRMS